MSSIDPDWFGARKLPVEVEAAGPFRHLGVVETLEGDFGIDREYIREHGGYYLVRGVQGEVYPCAEDVFEETYDVLAGSGDCVNPRCPSQVSGGTLYCNWKCFQSDDDASGRLERFEYDNVVEPSESERYATK